MASTLILIIKLKEIILKMVLTDLMLGRSQVLWLVMQTHRSYQTYSPWYMQICSIDVFPYSVSQPPCRFERTRSHWYVPPHPSPPPFPWLCPSTQAQPHGLSAKGAFCHSVYCGIKRAFSPALGSVSVKRVVVFSQMQDPSRHWIGCRS